MHKRRVDIIIFGASGYTGQKIVEQCAMNTDFSFAIAGRNIHKMRDLLAKLSVKTGIDTNNVQTMIADCSNQESMNEMARQSKLVINCTGPYRFYGENVIKACIEEGTHYVDVSGEPEFMEKMQLEYHNLAEMNGCYVVSSCGMDSVPADLGVLHFMKNFEGQVNYVEVYVNFCVNSNNMMEPFINYTTWESAVHSFANINSLISVRKKLFSKFYSKVMKPLPSLPRRSTIHRSKLCDDKYCLPFPGSDRSVIVRTQMFLMNEYNLRPVQCNTYMACNSVVIMCALLLVGLFLQVLTKYEFGIALLLNYPRIFSFGMITRGGPSEKTCVDSKATFKFYGEGWSKEMLKKNVDPKTIAEPYNSSMSTVVEIQDPAYGFTAMCAVQCAYIILNETEQLPSRGGVYTPGAAFYRTSLIETLEKQGMEFKILHKNHK